MARKSIIAVDDSAIVLRMLGKLLNNKYDFHAFSGGARALLYLKDRTPDLIILDIDMPEMNGYEVLEQIRGYGHLENIPVIFLTSNNDKTHVVKAVASGARDYVVKPIDEDILMDRIRSLLSATE